MANASKADIQELINLNETILDAVTFTSGKPVVPVLPSATIVEKPILTALKSVILQMETLWSNNCNCLTNTNCCQTCQTTTCQTCQSSTTTCQSTTCQSQCTNCSGCGSNSH